MKLPKIRELIEAIKALIRGPYTTKFPKVPHTPPEKFRGRPKFYKNDCVGCTACAQVCPADAVEVIDETPEEGGKRRLVIRYGHCIFCGLCQASCITEEGIKQTNEYDLADNNREKIKDEVEKELVYCQICREIITTKEHLKWVADKVKTATYSNPTLYLSYLREFGLTPRKAIEIGEQFNRSDRIKILCAKCRRKTTIEK